MKISNVLPIAVVAAAIVAGCGSEGDANIAAAEPPGAVTLADVATACADHDPDLPGVIEVSGELRDANTTVDVGDCVIRLLAGADVTLNNVTLTGGIVNIHDRDTDGGDNRIKLQRTTIEMRGLLVELNDAADRFESESLDVTVDAGFSLRIAETDDGANDGGFVRMVKSTVLATGVDAPVTVAASEHTGTVELVNTTLDTQGQLIVNAGSCSGRIRGEAIDCSTEAVADSVGGS